MIVNIYISVRELKTGSLEKITQSKMPHNFNSTANSYSLYFLGYSQSLLKVSL